MRFQFCPINKYVELRLRNMLMTAKKNNVESIPEILTNVTLLKMSDEIEQLKTKQKEICEMAARSILYALDQKDHYTFGHSMRVTYYALSLGKELKLDDRELYDLELAALFHDIGKIGIPDGVLSKPARLNEDEYNLMKQHPVKSAEILSGFENFERVALFAKHHHERFDGFGYPDGLKGENIPLFSRMILIGDTFDAMTSTRSYRKGLPHHIAFKELKDFSGSQFDPELVEHFIRAMVKERRKGESTFTLNIINSTFKKEAA